MSEVFYAKFLGFFFNFAVLLFTSLLTLEFLLFYISSRNTIFFWAYDVSVLLVFFYGINFYSKFKHFQSDFYLFLPKTENITQKDEIIEKNPLLEKEDGDLSLKVCRLYANGESLYKIKDDLGISHIFQAKRLLVKGLKLLLKNEVSEVKKP